MSQFASALGQKFVDNKEAVRTRTFELGGHTFKVKVPLTVESEAIFARIKEIDEAKVEEYYNELAYPLISNKDKMPEDSKVEFLENDVVIDGRSMRVAANNKALTEARITEMFKLLVPEVKDFDMNTITYKDIEELFPMPIQMQIVDQISNVISFDYGKTKEK